MTSAQPAKGYVAAWDVESLTEAGKVYVVSRRKDGSFACSCPAWKFAHAPKPDCKHIRALNDMGRLEATKPALVPIRAARVVRVYFDGVHVGTLTPEEADSFKFALSGKRAPEGFEDRKAVTAVSGEFRITRKYRED